MTATRSTALRKTNDLVRELSEGPDEPLPFFCECERTGCFVTAWLTPLQYDRIRRIGAPILALRAELGHEPSLAAELLVRSRVLRTAV